MYCFNASTTVYRQELVCLVPAELTRALCHCRRDHGHSVFLVQQRRDGEGPRQVHDGRLQL